MRIDKSKIGTWIILVLVLVMGAANLIATRNYVNQFKAQQRANGKLVEQKLCETLNKPSIVSPPPLLPTSNPYASVVNPGRQYDRNLHDVLTGLGPDISCPSR